MPTFARTSIVLCLLASAACCPTRVVTKTDTIRLKPPPVLLQPCPLPDPTDYETTEDVVDALLAWRTAARECAAGRDALRRWSEE